MTENNTILNDSLTAGNEAAVSSTNVKPKRDYTFDNYRGFVIFAVFLWCCMFLGQHGFNWTKHTDAYDIDVAFGMMDYGILMFSLAAGMVINFAFLNRLSSTGDIKKTRIHYARRGLSVMGIGALDLIFKMIGDNCVSNPYGWEVFMSIGFASIIISFFLGKKDYVRIIAGALILILYAVMAEYVSYVNQSLYVSQNDLTYGGPFGAIGLSGLMLWFSVLGDYFRENKRKFLLGVLVLWILAIPSIVISFNVVEAAGGVDFVNISNISAFKRTMSISFCHFTLGYLLFGGAFSLLTFLPIWGISQLIKKEIPFISTMGKNTIIFFFFYAICTIPTGMIADALEATPWLTVLINAAIAITLSFSLAYLFKRKNIIFKA